MKNAMVCDTPNLVLWGKTAEDLMTPSPVSIDGDAGVKEAVAFLIDKGFSAAPVIDRAGRPIGVLSRSDILVHDRGKADYLPPVPDYYQETDFPEQELRRGFQVENVDRTTVRDLMTPGVFSVSPTTPATKVIEEMLALKVHRLFVVSEEGVLIGMISALDILKHLRPGESAFET